jgi:hypothetical protein
MDRSRTSLATRSNSLTLVGWVSGQQEKSWQSLLNTEAPAEDWRLVELVGERPFEVALAWSAGSGVGGNALVTVSRSARVCVVARTLQVRVSNLANGQNRVSIHVAQPSGCVTTANVYELPVLIPASGSLEVALPPLAQRVVLELLDSELAKTTSLQLADGQAQARVVCAADEQPVGGLRVGGADQLTLFNAHLGNQVVGRVVFTLAL